MGCNHLSYQIKVDYKSASAPIIDQEVTQVIEDVVGGAEGIKKYRLSI